MSEADMLWFVSKLFLSYGVGWGFGYFILLVKKATDNI